MAANYYLALHEQYFLTVMKIYLHGSSVVDEVLCYN